MTLELDSKPTRTRRPKDTEPVGPGIPEAAAAIAAARERDAAIWDTYDHAVGIDPGEIPMDPEATAELRARAAHMGLGGPQEAFPQSILVTGYDANGEAIDAEVVRSERAQDAAATGEPDPERPAMKQIEMPGFEGHKATKVTVAFGGSITLDLGYPGHKAMWEALRWQSHASMNITAFVNGKGFKAGKDNVAGASLTVLSARLEAPGEPQPYEEIEQLPDDGPDDPCLHAGEDASFCETDDLDKWCQPCQRRFARESPEDWKDYADSRAVLLAGAPEPSALDEALAAALEGDE